MLYMAALYEAAQLRGRFRWAHDNPAVSQALTCLKEAAHLLRQEQPDSTARPSTTLSDVWCRAIIEGKPLDDGHVQAVRQMAVAEVFTSTPNWVTMVALSRVVRSHVVPPELRSFWGQQVDKFGQPSTRLANSDAQTESTAYVHAMRALARLLDSPERWVFDDADERLP
jgi:hypothetical protein